MKTLYDILQEADAIQIDDHFIRYFGFYPDEDEAMDATIFDASTTDEDGHVYEWFFTREELMSAVYIPETKEWKVFENMDEDKPFFITAYILTPIEKE